MEDVMVDIETTGTRPDHAGILQIAAVPFDMKSMSIGNWHFDRCLALRPGRYWDENTRQWWRQQNRRVLQSILSRVEDAGQVMQEFCHQFYPPSTYRFWSKPSHFDFNFISSYCSDVGLPNPFSFREAMDMNSFIRGLYAPRSAPELDIPFDGDKHNAAHDCIHQIKCIFVHMENAGCK